MSDNNRRAGLMKGSEVVVILIGAYIYMYGH